MAIASSIPQSVAAAAAAAAPGVIWFLGRVTSRKKKEHPYLLWDGYDAVYSHEGDSIIVGDAPSVAQFANFPNPLFEIDRVSTTPTWELGHGVFDSCVSLDYDELNDRVLACVFYTSDATFKIIEVKDGLIVNGPLTNCALGAIGAVQPGGLCYEGGSGALTRGRFWVALREHHVVILTDWTGTIHAQFGVYGVPVNDATHLNTPNTVCAAGAFIGDTGNNRIVHLNLATMAIANQLPWPTPAAFPLLPRGLAIGQGSFYVAGQPWVLPTYLYYLDEGTGIPGLTIHRPSNSLRAHPAYPGRILIPSGEIYEYNLSDTTTLAPPVRYSQGLWSAFASLAGVTYESAPIVDWLAPNQDIYIQTDQIGTMEIQAARWSANMAWPDFKWTGDWDTFDADIQVPATGLLAYSKRKQLGVYRVLFTPDVNATLNGWVIPVIG